MSDWPLDPDGVMRKPGRTAYSLINTPDGPKLLPEPATTVATDPSFSQVYTGALARTTTTEYGSFRTILNQDIKTILDSPGNHPLKLILEPRGNTLYWKPGTFFGGA